MINKYYKLTKATVKCKPEKKQSFCEKMCGLEFGNFSLNLNYNKEVRAKARS